ncbi:DUF3021 family protein [uncultured Ruminococcus sp.]|uniref:DUF3021 family protein n=1 Tax=uncultured Ruminococcus sp. TaxID=165186 RepID=UPI0025FF94D6|nr:DUF3021 family protein [uncultured Ruminococcus sp.]
MIKTVLKKIWDGLLYGSAMFALSLLMIDVVFDSSLTVLPHQYSRIVTGAIFIGVGFVLSTLIYEEDRIPFFVRTIIHLLLCAVTFIIAFFISGGIPDGTGFGTGAVFVLVEIGVGFVFWVGNFMYFFCEARIIKKSLKKEQL